MPVFVQEGLIRVRYGAISVLYQGSRRTCLRDWSYYARGLHGIYGHGIYRAVVIRALHKGSGNLVTEATVEVASYNPR